MSGGMRDVQVRRGPGSGPSRAPAVRRRVRQTTASIERVPRRFPLGHRGARRVPVERSGRAGTTWPIDRALVPNPLPSRDVQRRGTPRSEGCVRLRLPRGSKRHREGWSGSGRQYRRAMSRFRGRWHRCRPGDGDIGPGRGLNGEHVDRRRPAEADIRATAEASIGRYSSSAAPVPGIAAIAVVVAVLKTPQRMPAPPDQWASPAPRIVHDPMAPTNPDISIELVVQPLLSDLAVGHQPTAMPDRGTQRLYRRLRRSVDRRLDVPCTSRPRSRGRRS